VRGRFAPSPTGELHLGNLRTALVAWLSALHGGGDVVVRMEDLDPATSSRDHAARQLADLAALGLHPAGEVVFQSERFELYREAIARLDALGLVYRCYCTRREIREAAAAPHGDHLPDGAYPGTCRTLSAARQAELVREGRRSALRLRTEGDRVVVVDRIAGRYAGVVDDVVLQRNDGVPAYNLAVVVDDDLQGVTEVVRGDDLLSSTPRQIHLQHLLGLGTPTYAHVPLVVGPDGARLAKRHGGVTCAELAAHGVAPGQVLALLGASLGLCAPDERVELADLVARFDIARVPRLPWVPALPGR
jgi:glutamyl-tRNA synthetase